MVRLLLLEDELQAHVSEQPSSEGPGWPEGPPGKSGFGFHAASWAPTHS